MICKRYQFQGNSDLLTGWIDIDIPFEGTGAAEHLLTTLPIAGTNKFFWRVKALPEPDADSDGLGAFEESLLGTSDHAVDSDGDNVSDLVEFLNGLNPASNLDTDNDGLSDDWEVVSGTDPNDDGSVDPDNGPDGDINGDGISNLQAYHGGVNGSTTIGPVNLTIGEDMLSGCVALSFRPEPGSSGPGYPADLYDDVSVTGWEAVIGDFIEIWDGDDEGIFDTFIELQSHWNADGIKQEFEMIPDSQLTFILAYKGRYDDYNFSGNVRNAFSIKVEGAEEVRINGAAAQPDAGALSHSFMDDDAPNADPPPYESWTFASVTIKAGPDATNSNGAVDITLSLVPNELTDDYGSEVTYGGFVQLLKVDVEEDENWWSLDNSDDPDDTIDVPWMSIQEPLDGEIELFSKARVMIGLDGLIPLNTFQVVSKDEQIADMWIPSDGFLMLNDEKIFVKGVSQGITSFDFEVNGTSLASDFFKVDVLPSTFVSVKIHIVQDPDHSSHPDSIDEQSLSDFLARCWYQQANIFTDIDISTLSYDYDTYTDVGSQPIEGGDGSLDILDGPGNFSIEETPLVNLRDPDYDVNIYVVNDVELSSDNPHTETTIGVNRLNYGSPYGSIIFVESGDAQTLLETIAHELGHTFGIDVKLANSDDQDGHSSQQVDLMYPTNISGLDQTNMRKHQWQRSNTYVRSGGATP